MPKSPKGKSAPPPPPPVCDTSLASLQLFASDGAAEPVLPRPHPNLPVAPASTIQLALPPGMQWVSVRAVAQNPKAVVRIYTWDTSVAKEGRVFRRDLERLHLTTLQRPRERSADEQSAIVMIQSVIRGLQCRTRPAAFRPPPSSVENDGAARAPAGSTLTMAEREKTQVAEAAGLVRSKAEERWAAADELHVQAEAEQLAEAKAALERWQKKSKGKAGKKSKKVAEEEPPPPPEPKAVRMPGDEDGSPLQALAALPSSLRSFLRANLVSLRAFAQRQAEGEAAEAAAAAAAEGGGDDELGVEALAAALRALGLSQALRDTPADLSALVMALRKALGAHADDPVRLATLGRFLIAPETDLGRADFQRLSLLAAVEEALPPVSKAGKSGAKAGTKGGAKGGGSAEEKAALQLAKDELVQKRVFPERVLLVRVVVIAEDQSTRTHTLQVRVAPAAQIPPLPDGLQPVMNYAMRYHGVEIKVKQAFGNSKAAGAKRRKREEKGGRDGRPLLARSRTQAFTLATADAERAHAGAVASGLAGNGESALSSERFVAMCSTLRLANAEVARLAFADVTRERPSALLGASGVWAALFFAFARSLSPTPLDVSKPPHRTVFDVDAVLALAQVKLEPLQCVPRHQPPRKDPPQLSRHHAASHHLAPSCQHAAFSRHYLCPWLPAPCRRYNLGAVAAVQLATLNGESALLNQMAAAQHQYVEHWLVSGMLAGDGF